MILIVFMWLGILYYSLRELYFSTLLAECDVRTSHAVETFFVICNACILMHVGCVNFVVGVLTLVLTITFASFLIFNFIISEYPLGMPV
jgi:hypothetical protein